MIYVVCVTGTTLHVVSSVGSTWNSQNLTVSCLHCHTSLSLIFSKVFENLQNIPVFLKMFCLYTLWRDNNDFVGFRSLHTLGIYGMDIREKEPNTRRSGYKPLALLRIDLLGSLKCPM